MQMRCILVLLLACFSDVDGLDCSSIADCATCAGTGQGTDKCGWCGTSSKGSCMNGNTFGPKTEKCDRKCWFSGVTSDKCPGKCEGFSCGECLASVNCVWCGATDICVGQKAQTCSRFQCAKTDASEYCPKVSCSSLTKCAACAARDWLRMGCKGLEMCGGRKEFVTQQALPELRHKLRLHYLIY